MTITTDPFTAIAADADIDPARVDVLSADGLFEYRIEQMIPTTAGWAVVISDRDSVAERLVHGFASQSSASVWMHLHAGADHLSGFPYLRSAWALHRWSERHEVPEHSREFVTVGRSLSN